MALHYRTTAMPGRGVFVENITCRGINGNASVAMFVGQLVQMDLYSVSALTTDILRVEGYNGPTANPVTTVYGLTAVWQHPTTAGAGTVSGSATLSDPGYIMGIVTSLCGDTGATGKEIEVTISGIVDAYIDATEALLIGRPLVPDFAAVTADPTTTTSVGARLKNVVAATTVGVRIIGRVLEPVTINVAGKYKVLFDGDSFSHPLFLS